MPRKARLDAPGALHHIIVRGIEKKAIFRNVVDRKDFLKRLRAILLDTETSCYGWVLMRNHVHLLFRTGLVPIATLMQRLLTGYSFKSTASQSCKGSKSVKALCFLWP